MIPGHHYGTAVTGGPHRNVEWSVGRLGQTAVRADSRQRAPAVREGSGYDGVTRS